MMFGLKLEQSRPRDCVGEVERTHAGNVAVRVGQENPGGAGWHQTGYVVLEPAEAERFAEAILEARFDRRLS